MAKPSRHGKSKEIDFSTDKLKPSAVYLLPLLTAAHSILCADDGLVKEVQRTHSLNCLRPALKGKVPGRSGEDTLKNCLRPLNHRFVAVDGLGRTAFSAFCYVAGMTEGMREELCDFIFGQSEQQRFAPGYEKLAPTADNDNIATEDDLSLQDGLCLFSGTSNGMVFERVDEHGNVNRTDSNQLAQELNRNFVRLGEKTQTEIIAATLDQNDKRAVQTVLERFFKPEKAGKVAGSVTSHVCLQLRNKRQWSKPCTWFAKKSIEIVPVEPETVARIQATEIALDELMVDGSVKVSKEIRKTTKKYKVTLPNLVELAPGNGCSKAMPAESKPPTECDTPSADDQQWYATHLNWLIATLIDLEMPAERVAEFFERISKFEEAPVPANG